MPKNSRVTTATDIASAVEKDKIWLDNKEATDPSHLSPDAVAAQRAMLQAMKTACCSYNKRFWNLSGSKEPQVGENLGKSVDKLQWNPMYSERRQQDLGNMHHMFF